MPSAARGAVIAPAPYDRPMQDLSTEGRAEGRRVAEPLSESNPPGPTHAADAASAAQDAPP